MVIELAVMAKIRAMCAKLTHPNWMREPDTWTWCRPDGMPQGFGQHWRDEPGVANLLWLSMNRNEPPTHYDATANGLYGAVLMFGASSKLLGAPLLHMASTKTLNQFYLALQASSAHVAGNRLERAYPLLADFARQRMQNANP